MILFSCWTVICFCFFYRILQIDLPSDVRGFPSVGTMYWPMASRVTESIKETCSYVLQLNIVTKHCKKWCLLPPPPQSLASEANENGERGRGLTYQKSWRKKKGFCLVPPPPPFPSSEAYTHCKKSCFLLKICLVLQDSGYMCFTIGW